jgi:hypothetical protein
MMVPVPFSITPPLERHVSPSTKQAGHQAFPEISMIRFAQALNSNFPPGFPRAAFHKRL